MTAVYGKSTEMGGMFDYTSYIYLLAIVSLAIINPIGFVLMEYSKQSRDSNKKLSCDRVGCVLVSAENCTITSEHLIFFMFVESTCMCSEAFPVVNILLSLFI